MIHIGKIVATHGLNGDVVLSHLLNKKNWLKKEAVLFIELNKKSYIPFFVQQVKATQADECIIRFEDVKAVEAAKKLIGKPVFFETELLETEQIDSPLLWVGFNIIDKHKGEVGRIEEVIQTPHQWLAQVNYNGKEVLIPLIEAMLLEVNMRNKYIRMELPEGLLEL